MRYQGGNYPLCVRTQYSMIEIISLSPEVPDPTQLDLFTITTNESPSTSCINPQVDNIEQRSRDPTAPEIPIGKSGTGEIFDLSETQKELASALHRKSRALVSKNYQATIQEETKHDL